MYPLVLLPVGGEGSTERALKALEHARRLCSETIVLLHVAEPLPNIVGGEAREELVKTERAAAEERLRPVYNAAIAEGVTCSIVVEHGTPADTIVRVAHEKNADIIVMYTDGRDDVSSMLIGSITERVLRNTDTPLLAVRR